MRIQSLLRWVALFLMGSFGLLALDNLHMLGRYQGVSKVVISPAAELASDAAGRANGAWAAVNSIGDLNRTNQRLRLENQQLTQQNLELAALGRENASLRRLLDFKQMYPTHTYHPASIIAQGTNNLQPMLTLDQGAADGVKAGMAVVDSGGLIGQVVRADRHVAVVLPIDNPASNVAAYVNTGTGEPSGVVQYEPGGGLVLNFAQAAAPLRVGDWVLTSGLGGTFPRNFPVGRVRDLSQRAVDLFQIGLLSPAADIENDRLVLVVTDFVPARLPAEAP